MDKHMVLSQFEHGRHIRVHVVDNQLFTAFFRFLINRFKDVWEGTKRFHWLPKTKRRNVRVFYTCILELYEQSDEYYNDEILLFKLLFTTTTKKQMHKLGFEPQDIDQDWDVIEAIRQRKKNIKSMRQFFEIDVIRKLWFCQNGFYYSTEMKEFILTCLKHFQKYCEADWINLEHLKQKQERSEVPTSSSNESASNPHYSQKLQPTSAQK